MKISHHPTYPAKNELSLTHIPLYNTSHILYSENNEIIIQYHGVLFITGGDSDRTYNAILRNFQHFLKQLDCSMKSMVNDHAKHPSSENLWQFMDTRTSKIISSVYLLNSTFCNRRDISSSLFNAHKDCQRRECDAELSQAAAAMR